MKNRMFIVFSVVLALLVLAMPAAAAGPKATPVKPATTTKPTGKKYTSPKVALHAHGPHTNPQGKQVGNGDPTWYEWSQFWYDGSNMYATGYTQQSTDWPVSTSQVGYLHVIDATSGARNDPSQATSSGPYQANNLDVDGGPVPWDWTANNGQGDVMYWRWDVQMTIDPNSGWTWGQPDTSACAVGPANVMTCQYMQAMVNAPGPVVLNTAASYQRGSSVMLAPGVNVVIQVATANGEPIDEATAFLILSDQSGRDVSVLLPPLQTSIDNPADTAILASAVPAQAFFPALQNGVTYTVSGIVGATTVLGNAGATVLAPARVTCC